MSGRGGRAGVRGFCDGCGPGDCDQGHKLEAHERVMEERWKALEFRLEVIEALIGRVEKRLWATIVGLAGAVLTEALTSVLVP
jgi:hypothetical protein